MLPPLPSSPFPPIPPLPLLSLPPTSLSLSPSLFLILFSFLQLPPTSHPSLPQSPPAILSIPFSSLSPPVWSLLLVPFPLTTFTQRDSALRDPLSPSPTLPFKVYVVVLPFPLHLGALLSDVSLPTLLRPLLPPLMGLAGQTLYILYIFKGLSR